MSAYDIIIVGGGPVGLTLAATLEHFMSGMKIAVLDRAPLKVPSDPRASAIAAGVTQVFEAIGVWPEMQAKATAVEKMVITDSGKGDISRPLFLSFAGEVAPGRPYAHLVPNQVTIGALLEKVQDNVELIAPVSVTGFSADAGHGTIRLADGGELTARLVIAADGKFSALRNMARIGVMQHDYKQSGLVTTIRHEIDHQGTAYEHFRPAGPFASLPLPDSTSSLVWTEKTAEANRLAALPVDELALKIEEAMGSCLGSVEVIGKVQAFPLQLQIARQFTSNRLALIGDAAHVVHPIAGQGLNLGLKDVAALAEVVIEAMRLGQDHGGADVLEHYQRWRRFDTSLMAVTTDALNRLFSNDVAPIRAARDFGLGLVDRVPFVKSQLIRHAAGMGMAEPRLLKGMAI